MMMMMMMMISRAPCFVLLLVSVTACYYTTPVVAVDTTTGTSYGLGCSFPLAHGTVSCAPSVLGDRTALFQDYLRGCSQRYGAEACEFEEAKRVRKNSLKPSSMINMTQDGFQKRIVPDEIMALLTPFWNRHWHDNITEFHHTQKVPYSNNYWAVPPHLANVYGEGYDLVERTLQLLQPMFQDWTNQEWELRATSMYGIRSYQRGTMIAPHVDKDPLVLSAIINVDQDVDEPWPLEVMTRNGIMVNVTLAPGEMVLYEGHTTIHGRPFPFNGTYYANAFVHFEPVKRIKQRKDQNNNDQTTNGETTTITTAVLEDGRRVALPPYLIPESPWQPFWVQENPHGWNSHALDPLRISHTTPEEESAMMAATFGNVATLQELVVHGKTHLLSQPDPRTGYQPLHQAARFGHVQAIQFLLAHANHGDRMINAMTLDGNTALSLAMLEQANEQVPLDHEVFALLKQHGALRPEQLRTIQRSGSSVADLRQVFHSRTQATTTTTSKRKRRTRRRRA